MMWMSVPLLVGLMVITVLWTMGHVSIYPVDTHVPVRLDTKWTIPTPRVYQWTVVRLTNTRVIAMPRVSQLVQAPTPVNVYLNLRVMDTSANVRSSPH